MEYNENRPAVCQPTLDYLAPEYALGGKIAPFADVFRLEYCIKGNVNESNSVWESRPSLFSTKASFRLNTMEG